MTYYACDGMPAGAIAAGFLKNQDANGLRILSYGQSPNAFTFGCWWKPNDYDTAHTLMAFADSSDANGHKVLRAANLDGDLIARTERDNGAQGSNIDAQATTLAGQWQYCAGVWQGTNFREASKNGISSGANSATRVLTSDDAFAVGYTPHSTGDVGSNGWIAMPAIWSVALSAPELTMLSQGLDPAVLHPDSLDFLSYDMRFDYRGRYEFEELNEVFYAPFDHDPMDQFMFVPAAVVGGANPHGPLGHPLMGAFGGPM